LQGSVATLFRRGEVRNNLFTVNFLLSATVKEFFFNPSILGEDVKEFGACFGGPPSIGASRFCLRRGWSLARLMAFT